MEWLSGEPSLDLIQKWRLRLIAEKTRIVADKIMIAVGSEPVCLPNVAFDEKQIVSSTGALLERVPERLVVIGAGILVLRWDRCGRGSGRL